MENPTQQGASIQDRLMSYLDPQETPADDPKEAQQEAEIEPVEAPTSNEMEAEPADIEVESEPVSDETPTDEPQLSLSDVASILGTDEDSLDVDDEGNVLVKTKIDGQEGTAKFKDVLASYQLRGHVDNKSREVSQLQEQLKQEQAALAQKEAERLQQAEDIIQIAWGELTNEYNEINWNELKQLDPAEYAVKRSDFQDRQTKLQQAFQAAQSKRQEQTQAYQQTLVQHLAEENQKLTKAIKGWDNPDIAQKEFKETMSFLQNKLGFSEENLFGKRDAQGNILVPGITDHRLVVLAQKAMLYDKLQGSKPEVTKKVKVAPKMVKPGQPKSQQEQQKTSLDKLKQNIKTGKRGSAAEYLLASGKI